VWTIKLDFSELIGAELVPTPKREFFLMTWSTSVQIYIKFSAREAFVSRIQIWLYNTEFELP
jgi:hypothetical protein